MSKQDKLLTFYQHVLNMLNVHVEEDDALTGSAGQPLLIDDRRVYLPTNAVLKSLTQDMVGFHPLCENVFEGMSDIVVMLRKLAMCRLSDVVLMSVYSLLKLAVDKAAQATLSASQVEVIAKLADTDEKLIDSIEKLSEHIDVDTPNRIINLALRHSPLDSGADAPKNGRSCHVTSPLWDELERTTDATVFGVKFRKKDIPVLKEALKIVLPHIDETTKYSTDSSSPVAPYFVTFLKTVMLMIADTNKITWKFRAWISEVNHGQSLHVPISDAEFLGAIENIKDIANAVKPLPYNMGNKAVESTPRETNRRDDPEPSEVLTNAAEAVSRLTRATSSEELPRTRERSARRDEYDDRDERRSPRGRGYREDDRRDTRRRYDDESRRRSEPPREGKRTTPIGVRQLDNRDRRGRRDRYDDEYDDRRGVGRGRGRYEDDRRGEERSWRNVGRR